MASTTFTDSVTIIEADWLNDIDYLAYGIFSFTDGNTALTFNGTLTGPTFNATGDTAAGDNAVIGYTATEGLILTGQGSTGDVTIKNDADTTVVNILTGTQNVNFAPASFITMDRTTEDAPFINFKATADADATSAISTNTTSGSTTHHIQIEINGTTAWFAASTTDPS